MSQEKGRIKPVPVAILGVIILGLIIWMIPSIFPSLSTGKNDWKLFSLEGRVKSYYSQDYEVSRKFGEWTVGIPLKGTYWNSFALSYDFDKDGYCHEERIFKDGKVSSLEKNEHEDGKIVKKTTYEPVGTLKEVSKYNYLTDTHLERTDYSSDGDVSWKEVREWSGKDDLVLETTTTNYNRSGSFWGKRTIKYTYDDDDRMLTEVQHVYDKDETLKEIYTINYSYEGDDVNILKVTKRDGSLEAHQRTECIERDEQGNCVKLLSFELSISSLPSHVTVRRFEYY